MFRITEDPSLGSLAQCLAKNYKNDFIVSVGMDMVGVMAVAVSGTTVYCHFVVWSFSFSTHVYLIS